MPINFKKIQQTYPDALQLKTARFPDALPIGESGLAGLLGGGKVLHYECKPRQEHIVVSKIAANKITVFHGPPGSGKSFQARLLAESYPQNQVFWTTYGWLQGGECIVPEATKMVVIDEFLSCGKRFGSLLSRFISEKTGENLQVHIVVLVQTITMMGYEPAYLWGAQFKGHPVEWIETNFKPAL